MTTQQYTVTGMTCEHCVRAVTEEVTELDGVTTVAVDLGAETVTVTSTEPVADEALRAAIDEAGYTLVS